MTETGYKDNYTKLCCICESKFGGKNEAHFHAGHSITSSNDKTQNVLKKIIIYLKQTQAYNENIDIGTEKYKQICFSFRTKAEVQ